MIARPMAVVLILGGFASLAAAEVDDGCRDVLVYSARNYSVEAVDIGVALKIYDQYCQNDTFRKEKSFGLGFDAVIKAVPIKFNLGSGSTEERASFFCKTFDSDYKSRTQYYRSISEVASESTNAWLACKALASQGILFRPRIAATQFVIEVARTNATSASVEGVIYDRELLSCTVPNSDKSTSRTDADGNTTKSLSDAYWPVTCVRKPQQEKNETIYPKVDISIGTTKGAFLLPIPAEALYPYQWSSDIQKRLDLMAAHQQELTDRLAEEKGRNDKLSNELASLQNSAIRYGGKVRLRNEVGGRCMDLRAQAPTVVQLIECKDSTYSNQTWTLDSR